MPHVRTLYKISFKREIDSTAQLSEFVLLALEAIRAIAVNIGRRGGIPLSVAVEVWAYTHFKIFMKNGLPPLSTMPINCAHIMYPLKYPRDGAV